MITRWHGAFSVSTLRFSFAICALAFVGGCAARQGPAVSGAMHPVSAGESSLEAGRLAFAGGQFETAATQWQRAVEVNHAAGQRGPEADAMIDLATAYEMLGQFNPAKCSLDDAAAIARSLGDTRREYSALNTLGAVCTMKPDAPAPTPTSNPTTAPASHCSGTGHDTQAIFARALDLATQAGDVDAEASINDNLGNYLADRGNFDDALAHYTQCVQLSDSAGNKTRIARGLANAGACALTAAEAADVDAYRAKHSTRQRVRDTEDEKRQHAVDMRQKAADWDGKALAAVEPLPDSHTKATLLNLVGQTDQRTARDVSAGVAGEPDAAALITRARKAYCAAIESADAVGDQRALSYACGYLGHLDEMAAESDPTRREEAMTLTRRAVFAAQRAQCNESLYRWEWQTGRLLADSKDVPGAIDACQRAVQSVRTVRADIALGNGNQRSRANFREDVGKLYFDLADLLLRQVDLPRDANAAIPAAFVQPAGNGADEAQTQKTLVQARETVELLKSAELEDYLRDECVPTYRTEHQGIQKIEQTTAVVYIIPLDDRIEILVQFGDRLRRYVTPVGQDELSRASKNFRNLITYQATDEYYDPGAQLYKWLINPIRKDLTAAGVDTLIFVPDGILRTIPMAALVDAASGQFLIQQYTIGVVPSLSLTSDAPSSRSGKGAPGRLPILVNGLSEAVGKFPALPYVSVEVQNVRNTFPDQRVDSLLNKSFIVENLKGEFQDEQPSVVHIASHGQFGSEAKDTFIVTAQEDNPLTLNGLEQLVRVNNYKGRTPVGLLVLSACQTAAGDDRAALGLGGIAVKSGARSAVATLWKVSDESSTELISDFYAQLRDHRGVAISKSLQAAQLKMIEHPSKLNYRHPYFWAPYLMIGNWH